MTVFDLNKLREAIYCARWVLRYPEATSFQITASAPGERLAKLTWSSWTSAELRAQRASIRARKDWSAEDLQKWYAEAMARPNP